MRLIKEIYQILREAKNVNKMYIVTYKMRSQSTEGKFMYSFCDELHHTQEIEFVNAVSGQTLTLLREDLSYYIVKKVGIDEN